MISDQTAQRIASDWHGGGGSALYQFASTGAITERTRTELVDLIATSEGLSDHARIGSLYAYCLKHGERGPVADWYERVISAD